ncbi:MAG: hypothetical protein CMJ21_04490 [Phycisphaerae bacterium]|nr:hypothetical protein [Phycisphaerae bacterium]
MLVVKQVWHFLAIAGLGQTPTLQTLSDGRLPLPIVRSDRAVSRVHGACGHRFGGHMHCNNLLKLVLC